MHQVKEIAKLQKLLETMDNRALEFAQVRSKFQLEKFVGLDEHTPITQFRHLAHNSYVALQEVRRLHIEQQRSERKIKRLNNDMPLDYDLDVFDEDRKLININIRIKGLLAEIDYMEYLCGVLEAKELEATGTKFTNEKLQADEAIYWGKRLSTQIDSAKIGMQAGGEGNYTALMKCTKSIDENSPKLGIAQEAQITS